MWQDVQRLSLVWVRRPRLHTWHAKGTIWFGVLARPRRVDALLNLSRWKNVANQLGSNNSEEVCIVGFKFDSGIAAAAAVRGI